jgi:hypothetical protein
LPYQVVGNAYAYEGFAMDVKRSGLTDWVRRIVPSAFLLSTFAIFSPFPATAARNVTLAWDASPSPGVVAYRVYHGVASRSYTNQVTAGNTTSGTLSNLVEGTTYFFAATAVNDLGVESEFSEELYYTIPEGPSPNQPPTLNPLNNLSIAQNSGLQTVPLAGISAGAADEVQPLAVTASSSNPTLLPHPTVNYVSPNTTGTLTFTPAANAHGTATITVTVNDGQAQNSTVTRSFTVTVNPLGEAPTISGILDQITVQEVASAWIPFTIADADTATSNLMVVASAENSQLVAQTNIAFSGVDEERALMLIPSPGQSGETEITVTVSDGQSTASTTFRLTVVVPSPNLVTVVTNGVGTVTPNLATTQNLIAGRTYTFSAVGGEGQMFAGWTGCTNSTSPKLSLVARSNLVLQANFVPLNLNVNGAGTIAPNLKTARNLIPGKTYTVKAVGGPGQVFAGWTGTTNSLSPTLRFVMETNFTLQAHFLPLHLSVNGSGVISPNLMTVRNLQAGRLYTIKALPASGYVFAGWSGNTNYLSPMLRFVLQTNLSFQAEFIPSPYIPVVGNYSGLFYEDDEVKQHSAGYFNVSVTSRGTYSGRLQIGSSRHSFSGMLALDLQATNVIMRSRTNALTLRLRIGGGDEINQISGSLTEGNWTAALLGDRAVYNARYNPAPTAGYYTMLIPGESDEPTLPAGDGYGSVRVSTAGLAVFSGRLADGTRVTQTASVSNEGLWPLYAALYAGRGSVLGWLAFGNQPTDDLSGNLNWIKPADVRARYYPAGFTAQTRAVGSRYVAPIGTTDPILSPTNASVVFNGGELDDGFTNSIALGLRSRVSNLSSNSLTLNFSLSLGTYSGKVVVPGTQKSSQFYGAILQKHNRGYGYMLVTNQSSRVLITPMEE